MLSFSLFALPLLLISGCHGCGTLTLDYPVLGVKTAADVQYADTDDLIYAKVSTGGSNWSPWRRLDNSNCDDREQGNDDFFNDFKNDFTSLDNPKWEAVSFYACGNNGWALNEVWFWNGNGMNKLDMSYSRNEESVYGDCDAYFTADSKYPMQDCQGIWVDGDSSFGEDCEWVTINTENGEKYDHPPGGAPNCNVNSAKVAEGIKVDSEAEEGAFTVVMSSSTLSFAVMVGLVALNVLLLCIICYGKARKAEVYRKVEMVSSAEVDEEESMM